MFPNLNSDPMQDITTVDIEPVGFVLNIRSRHRPISISILVATLGFHFRGGKLGFLALQEG